MLREARFTVPSAIWDELDPDDSTQVDGLDWELFDSDGVLVDSGQTLNLSHSPVDRGERFQATFDIDIPEGAGEYELYTEVLGAYSYTEFIEKADEELPVDDHYTIRTALAVPVDRAVHGAGDVPWELYRRNELAASGTLAGGSDDIGIDFESIDGMPSLDPYSLIVGDGSYTDHRIFHINATLLAATRDLRTYLDRLNRKVRLDSLQFSDSDYLLWLMHGRDRFNALPPVTDFTMTKATGPIRSLWLAAAQLEALRVRYLEEGLTQYDYSGSAVNLTLDVTQYLESLASSIEQRLSGEALQFKKVAAQRGLVGGTGEWSVRNRNTGVVGITLGPVTGHRRSNLYRSLRRF